MYAAMTALQAQQAATPGSKSALILLSDGGANSSKFGSGFGSGSTYPSENDQCAQTVAAGQYAMQTLGMTVYTVAYGASNNTSDCSTDSSPSITPCAEMLAAASNASDFYSDATAQANKGVCASASNRNLDLKGIFQSIANRFTAARLVPNSVRRKGTGETLWLQRGCKNMESENFKIRSFSSLPAKDFTQMQSEIEQLAEKDRRLTRSIHRSYVVKSGMGPSIVGFQER